MNSLKAILDPCPGCAPCPAPGKPAIGIPQILSILAWILVFTSFVLQIEEVRSKAIVDPADHILVAAFG